MVQLFKTNNIVNVSLKFQMLKYLKYANIFVETCVKLLHCKSFSFFQQKISVYMVIKS